MTAPVLWTAAEIAAVTQGTLIGDNFNVTGISIDTRSINPGDLFIALKGPNFDGHDFVTDALAKGAAGVLVEHGSAPQHIVVKDIMRGLQDLGAGARARSHAKIVAVTGSVGKTSVKAMLATAFSALGKTHAAEASLNNHWGVPLSLARMPVDAEFAIFEIGMNHANEISPLSKLVAPHLSIITTIASAHIAHLGSIENIALAKAEIFHGMQADGIAILPRDSEQYALLLAEARTQGLQHIISFGEGSEADIRLVDFIQHEDASSLKATLMGQEVDFDFGVPGKHQAVNSLSVLAAVKALGFDIEKPLQAFAAMKPVGGRGNRQELEIHSGQLPIVLIDETHNASPIAVKAALQLLAQMPVQGRRIAILGDMLELGNDGPSFHKELAGPLQQAGVDLVMLSGPLMAHLAENLPADRVRYYPTSTELAQEIEQWIQPGDAILVKGSRGSKMKLVVDALVELRQFKK
jgi:UDP-N-acetylmuramoyl-tripeptide--D-alanyl-D-alanine ligase